ncbi:hypothetical protein HYDPIDRAFT_98765 [Hydnomerulius pinastri MD-312]|uniref:Sugar phosphate phosphatase n=1 Tax=Hydnomerulius pinastri MD-312 TaxID=994086 RepID=A0A0C9W307_9AGAM|nr:hypothetical protein HYDPIDRAFT_98765 [Hydnomerulius pinastri MD-312]
MFKAPYPPYDPLDKSGYDTVVKRWPIIITNLIDHVHRLMHDMTIKSQQLTESEGSESDGAKELQQKVEEGKKIIAKASRLKYRMARDQELEQIPEDGDIDVDVYNAELAELANSKQNTWFTAPWLYAECYLYRLFRSYFNETTKWRNFDPFFAQKEEMFKNSGAAIYQIATTMHELESEKDKLKSDPQKLLVLFREMIQMCLWFDLSLLTHLTPADIENLQTVGKDAQQARKEYILKDDQEAVWDYIKTLTGPDKRCDFVLDNAGFELFTDLVFADFLVTYTPYFSKVVFHPKLFPWFVSDVTPTDFEITIKSLLSSTFFPAGPVASPESAAHLQQMVKRWQTYLDNGTFVLSTNLEEIDGEKVDGQELAKFWTGPWPYWNMKERANQLWGWLHGSDLVVFKVCPLAGSFPLLSLRTNKADVAVGVPQEIADKLDERGEKWRVSGKYALVSFEPRGSISSES